MDVGALSPPYNPSHQTPWGIT